MTKHYDFVPNLDETITICNICGRRINALSNFDNLYCEKHGFTTVEGVIYVRADAIEAYLNRHGMVIKELEIPHE